MLRVYAKHHIIMEHITELLVFLLWQLLELQCSIRYDWQKEKQQHELNL